MTVLTIPGKDGIIHFDAEGIYCSPKRPSNSDGLVFSIRALVCAKVRWQKLGKQLEKEVHLSSSNKDRLSNKMHCLKTEGMRSARYLLRARGNV